MPRAIAAALFAALLANAAAAALSDDAKWPSRAVRIVVAQAAGGPPALIARFIADPSSARSASRSPSTTAPAPPAYRAPGRGLRLTLFPKEWHRDAGSVWLQTLPTDAPWHDPGLLTAMLRLPLPAG